MTLHFQNDVHDVIARRKVLPPGDWKQRLPARGSSWSLVHSYLLSYVTQTL